MKIKQTLLIETTIEADSAAEAHGYFANVVAKPVADIRRVLDTYGQGMAMSVTAKIVTETDV